MTTTTVWAFQALAELNNATGFVECDEQLAARLIKEGAVQDPRDGGAALKPIEASPPAAAPDSQQQLDDDDESDDGDGDDDDDEPGEYKTKVVTPRTTRPRTRKRSR